MEHCKQPPYLSLALINRLLMPEPVHPDEGIKTNLDSPKQPETASDSRRRLEQAAGVNFHENAETELLVDLAKICDEARDQRRSERLRELLRLRERVWGLGGEVTHFELKQHDASPTRDVTDRQWPQHVLNVLVEKVVQVWREHSSDTDSRGSYFSEPKGYHDGPLIRLLLELFEQAEIPKNRRPGRHTLHNAIQRATDKFSPY